MTATPEEKNHFASNVDLPTEEPSTESNEKYYVYSIVGVIVAFVAPIIGLIISLIVLKLSEEEDTRTRRLAIIGSFAGGLLFIATIFTLLFFGNKY